MRNDELSLLNFVQSITLSEKESEVQLIVFIGKGRMKNKIGSTKKKIDRTY